ncbi:hypothetical protein Pfo_016094 [Paulownia fortunei]|nr:hypothetical protein Pfo_016094 [Paulownia fortunei]
MLGKVCESLFLFQSCFFFSPEFNALLLSAMCFGSLYHILLRVVLLFHFGVRSYFKKIFRWIGYVIMVIIFVEIPGFLIPRSLDMYRDAVPMHSYPHIIFKKTLFLVVMIYWLTLFFLIFS